jgi:hypothetical protein
VQGSSNKSQLRRNNGTDVQRSGCYANGRRARVPGGTTPGARYVRPGDDSRLSEEASALPAARVLEHKADGVKVKSITVVTSIDPELLENLIDMGKIDADSVKDCTDKSVIKDLESTQVTLLSRPNSSKPKCCRT